MSFNESVATVAVFLALKEDVLIETIREKCAEDAPVYIIYSVLVSCIRKVAALSGVSIDPADILAFVRVLDPGWSTIWTGSHPSSMLKLADKMLKKD